MIPSICEIRPGPFKSGYRPTSTPVITPTANRWHNIFRTYEKMLEAQHQGLTVHDREVLFRSISGKLVEVLEPAEIQAVLLATQFYEQHLAYTHATGHLISDLVQNSHNNKATTFSFDISMLKPIDCFCSNLKSPEQNLEVVVYGTVDDWAFLNSEGTFYAQSSYGRFATDIKGRAYTLTTQNTWPAPNSTHGKAGGEIIVTENLTVNLIQHWLYPNGERLVQIRDCQIKYDFFTPDQSVHEMLAGGPSWSTSQIVSNEKFNPLWKPCLAGFERLDELFGAKR